MKKMVFMFAVLMFVSCTNATQNESRGGDYFSATINNPSLQDALLGAIPTREIGIYLPPGYDSSDEDYPVLYFLCEFYKTTKTMNEWADFRTKMDEAILYDGVKPFILVVVNGISYYPGSFYVNSPSMGNWEDYLIDDVVAYIDENYRTQTDPQYRGIAGHVMGGYGAISIAMHRPDAFGIVYAMTPPVFPTDMDPKDFVTDGEVIMEFESLLVDIADSDIVGWEDLVTIEVKHYNQFVDYTEFQYYLAYASVFAYVTNETVSIYEFPYSMEEGMIFVDDTVWDRWEGGFGKMDEKISSYSDNLKMLTAMKIDIGTGNAPEWNVKGVSNFVELLSDAGVTAELDVYSSDYDAALPQRYRNNVAAFFSENLPSTESTETIE